MNLDDLIPRALLDDALEQGHVRKQTHPDLPLAILNYTERAAYDSIWNEATLTCRGLIYDERDRRIPAGDVRVKIKQADYVALHRIVTGLNKRTVWEHLGAGKPIEDLIEPLPDEFRPWVEDVVAELSATVAAQAREIEREYDRIVAELDAWTYVGADGAPPFETGWKNAGVPDVEGKPWSRKQFAELATRTPWAWALFQRLDGKDYGPKLWHLNRPDPETPAGRVYTEDAA